MCYEKNVETRRNFDAFALDANWKYGKFYVPLQKIVILKKWKNEINSKINTLL